jgi:hypothetical protein
MSLEFWSNLATVWLAFLCFIGMLIPLAAVIFAVKGMHVAVDRTPGLFRQVQGHTHRVRVRVESTGEKTVQQVVRSRSAVTRVQARVARLLGVRQDNSARGEPKL